MTTATGQDSFHWPAGKQAAISISLDDARPSQVDAGLPVLDRYGIRATFYLSPSNIPLRQDIWRDAVARGHEMGNHTLTHPCSGNFPWSLANALEDMTLADIESEMERSDEVIEQLVGMRPRSFAYPCGQKFVGRGQHLSSYIPVAGRRYMACRGFRDEAVNNPQYCDLAQVMGVDSDDHPFNYLKAWVDRAIAERGWLVFCSHDVGSFPRQAITVENLGRLCELCVEPEMGIWVNTIAEVAAYIQRHRAARAE